MKKSAWGFVEDVDGTWLYHAFIFDDLDYLFFGQMGERGNNIFPILRISSEAVTMPGLKIFDEDAFIW
jgi:hypothetical protein